MSGKEARVECIAVQRCGFVYPHVSTPRPGRYRTTLKCQIADTGGLDAVREYLLWEIGMSLSSSPISTGAGGPKRSGC